MVKNIKEKEQDESISFEEMLKELGITKGELKDVDLSSIESKEDTN